MQAVDKDQVRMLVTAVGYRQASLQTGIKEPTLRKWAQRGNWNKPVPHAQDTVTTVTKPADALAATLAERRDKSKLHLSEYVVKASKAAAKHKRPLKITGAVRDVAATHGSVWPEEQRGSGVNVFGQAVIVTDEQIADLRRRLAKARGDDVPE